MTSYSKTDSEDCRLRTADGPNVTAMVAELTRAATDSAHLIHALERDERVRFNRWTGQQDDGRKPATVGNRPAQPWPGASDTRVPLTDGIILEQVNLMKSAARKAKLTVRGTEGADFGRAGKVQLYVDYLRNSKLRKLVARESDLAANWRQTHGRCVMSVTWQQEYERVFDTVTVPELQQAAQANPQGPQAILLTGLFEPDREVQKQLASLLVQLYQDLDKGEAYRQLQALRTTGSMSLPRRSRRLNEPLWEALKPWRDVIYPLNTEDLQRAPWIAWRRTFTPAQVMEKEIGEGWSAEFVAAVIETEGTTLLDIATQTLTGDLRRDVVQDEAEEMDGLCEVFYFYYTHADERGVPCKYRTVLSPHVKGGEEAPTGPDEPAGYDHGKYPFVEHRRERPDRMLEASRGVSVITATAQMEKKAMRDARINQTELFLQPPTVRPEREIGLPLKIQPRGEIGERRANSTRQWGVANTAPAGEPLEMAAQRDVDGYFARNRAEDPVRAALFEQVLADDWCDELAECWLMTLQLAQQFEDDVQFSRIVGGQPQPFRVARDEIQGGYDLQFFFNTDQLDPEKIKAKTELLNNLLVPMDRAGILNLAPVVSGLGAYYFPEFADAMIQGVEQAGAAEVKDEQNNWSLMMAGTEPPMADKGQNFQLRLSWLQSQLQQPGSQQRLMAQPDSRELVQRRMEHLQFVVSQFTNQAQAGRVGVSPQAGPGAQG
jgi:hypothetical protein